jgi:cytochrome c-type biogenesis protein CcmE
MVSSKLKLGIGLSIGVLAVVLLFRSLGSALLFSVPLEEMVFKRQEYVGKIIKLEAEVITSSIAQKPGTLEYRFDVKLRSPRDGVSVSTFRDKVPANSKITVVHNGVVPDTLWMKDETTGIGAEVTVTGVLREDGVFESEHVLAKCPSKYEEAKTGAPKRLQPSM